MQKISYSIIDNIPVFKCSACKNCTSIESINAFNFYRGCCFYFPKYSLIDIKHIINYDENFLFELIKEKNVIIHDYYIRVVGTFYKEKYKKFLENNLKEDLLKYGDFDTSLFFKKCYFVSEKGCSISFKLRPYECNLYLCRHVVNKCRRKNNKYSRERKDYFAYCSYTNMMLKEDLIKSNINLKNNFKECIELLKKDPIYNFSFSNLENIEISS